MKATPNITAARPVLKWAGGKSQLLPELAKRLPGEIAAYHEPFVGGGALFFELRNQGRIHRAFLSDVNLRLIEVYVSLRDCVDDVISALRQHKHDEEYYYRLRSVDPEVLTLPERAARILYLNKTCYNGLYRENRRGQFNVPFGRYKNPTICDGPNLRAASKALQGIDISQRDFLTVLDCAVPGDFVYFDPPYHPVSATSNFTSYDKNGFAEEDHIRLRDVFRELAKRGISALLSNSDTPFVRELYSEFAISKVYASRAVNSKASARGRIAEVIVSNFRD